MRVAVVLAEEHPDPNAVAAQVADALVCSIATACGFRAGLSMIARVQPDIVILEQQYAFVEGRAARDLITAISPGSEIVFVSSAESAGTTAAGE